MAVVCTEKWTLPVWSLESHDYLMLNGCFSLRKQFGVVDAARLTGTNFVL